jgi:aminopeptidase YwaD
MFICIATGVFQLYAAACFAQPSSSAAMARYFRLARANFTDSNAYHTVAFMERYWRVPGNTGYNESIFHIENILRRAGFVKEDGKDTAAPLTYRIEKNKMEDPTWEPLDANLSIVGDEKPLLEFKTNKNMLAINSGSTPVTGITAELVYVGYGSEEDFKDKDVRGKIILGEGSIWKLYNAAKHFGAVGVLCYSIPSFNEPEKHPNSISFQPIPPGDPSGWGILLSYSARQKLKSAMQKGRVFVKVVTESKIYPSDELTLVANVRGRSLPNERFVLSAHVQEPGANDNATGVGTLAEMARVTGELVTSEKLRPSRSITFLWGLEVVGLRRYIKEDSLRALGIRWGLSLDMVGEDIKRTGGTFLIEKMPDPSAIWTRGDDKHTAWGGTSLKEADLFPHFFNDFILDICMEQSRETGWTVRTNPYEGGSDHTPFIEAGIPGLLMWHFTDVFYHTDGDRLDMVSGAEMKNVGVSALVAVFTLTGADEKTTLFLVDEIRNDAMRRLGKEFELSRRAIQNGANASYERHILESWARWYEHAFDTMGNICVSGTSNRISRRIGESKTYLEKELQREIHLI